MQQSQPDNMQDQQSSSIPQQMSTTQQPQQQVCPQMHFEFRRFTLFRLGSKCQYGYSRSSAASTIIITAYNETEFAAIDIQFEEL